MAKFNPTLSTLLVLMVWLPALAQNPLAIPDTLSGSSITLTLQRDSVQFFPGTITQTMGVNGPLLGPTVILDRYQHVQMNVENQLGEPTTIHWHGLHVAPENDGGPHNVIPAGTTWRPAFEVLDWAATYWYHPHLHMKTNHHVQLGIAGLIIVRDTHEAKLDLPRTYGVDDFPLVVQTKAFDANNQVIIESQLDTALLVNGTLRPYLDVPAQRVRFRVLNGSSERTYVFGFSDNRTFHQIATDGGLLSAPVPLTRLRLSPGERAEIIIDFSSDNGNSVQLRNFGSELPNGIHGAAQPGMGPGQTIPGYAQNPLNGGNYTVLDLHVGPPTANPPGPLPTTLVSHNPWSAASADTTRQFTFTAVNMGPTALQGPFLINNQPFDMMHINFEVPFENIEIWELNNTSPIAHPLHIHNVPFYILSINGAPPPPNMAGRKDVVLVPSGMGSVRFITKFETHYNDTLPYMYHCHLLTHEDHGMMGQFIVRSPRVSTGPQLNPGSIALWPNPVAPGSPLHLRLPEGSHLQRFALYHSDGRLLYSETNPQPLAPLTAPAVPGLYLLHMRLGDMVVTEKFVVR